jgi:hypothetical protein
VLSPTYANLKEESLQCSPVSHAQAHITTEQDSGADLKLPPSSVLLSKRAVEPSGPAPHERARAPGETGEPPKSAAEVVPSPRRRNPQRDRARGLDRVMHATQAVDGVYER